MRTSLLRHSIPRKCRCSDSCGRPLRRRLSFEPLEDRVLLDVAALAAAFNGPAPWNVDEPGNGRLIDDGSLLDPRPETVSMLDLGISEEIGPQTFYVDDNAPDDPGAGDPGLGDPLEDGSPAHPFDAIQEAITAAADGDTVLVLGGTYTGAGNRDVDFLGKAITVRSQDGPESCIVDCQASDDSPHRGFLIDLDEGKTATLEGFTIKGGYLVRSGWDGGIGGAVASASAPR